MDAKWLNEQFEKFPHKTKGHLGDILGIQASGISKMLAGTRQIKAREYMLMRTFFEMPGSGRIVERKIHDSYPALKNIVRDGAAQNWTPGRDAAQADYTIVEVSDAAMAPDFLPGERVLIDRTTLIAERPGIFAFKDETGARRIRMIEQVPNDKLKLSSLARDDQPMIFAKKDIKILGRVIAKLNWL